MTKNFPWIFGVCALWLVAAPFILGYSETTTALWNDVAVGVVTLVLAGYWGFRHGQTA
jgi:hypothetical protein